MLPGELTAFYLIAYSIGRILLEQVRLDSRVTTLFGLETMFAVATLVSAFIALLAALAILVRRRIRRPAVG